jgi:hypothetical protein
MTKKEAYEDELKKLNELFNEVEENTKKLNEGLIKDAAFLYAENYELKQVLDQTGMVKIHPDNLSLQKTIPAAKEYRQNLNSYAVVIKTLNSVLNKGANEEDDDMDDYE